MLAPVRSLFLIIVFFSFIVNLSALLLLFDEGNSDTVTLGQRDEWLLAVTNHENVVQTRSKRVAMRVLHVGNLVRTWVVLDRLEGADTTDVVSAGNKDKCSIVELANALDLVVIKLQLNGVVLVDVGMRVADCSAIVGHDVWHLVLAGDLTSDLAQLVAGLLLVDAVRHEAALHIVENTELFASLLNAHNILEAEWELMVTADLVVNLDVTFTALDNLKDLLLAKSVLQSLSEEHRHGDALTELVGTS